MGSVPEPLAGLSADGGLAVLWIARSGRPPGYYLIDARTGQSLRELGPDFIAGRSVLTADGRWLVGIVSESRDRDRASARITDARTGAVLVRTPLTIPPDDGRLAVAADGRTLLIHDPGRKELAYYDLQGDVPAVPVGTPTPPPAPAPATTTPLLAPLPPRALRPGAKPSLPDLPVIAPRWTVEAPAALRALAGPQIPLYSPDGKTLVLSGGADGKIRTFSVADGAAGPVFDAHKGLGGVDWAGVYAEKVVSAGFDEPLAFWSSRTGMRADDWKFPALPPLPDGARGHAGITRAVSPGGHYTVVARRELEPIPGPFRLLNATNGDVLAAAEWRGLPENVAFTADGKRLFVLNGLGKAIWYALPSGNVERTWEGPALAGENARLLGMSADGKRVVIRAPFGAVVDVDVLINGETGQFIRQFNSGGAMPYRGFAMSPDGRLAAVAVWDGTTHVQHTDFVLVEQWRPIARITHPPENNQDHTQTRFSKDGKELAVFFRGAKKLAVYPVPNLTDPTDRAAALPERWATEVGQTSSALPFAHDPETRQVVLVQMDWAGVTILDAETGIKVLPAPARPGVKGVGGTLTVLPDGKFAFHGARDEKISVWDLKAQKAAAPIPVPPFPGDDEPTQRTVWLSPDKKYAAVVRNKIGTWVVERATGKTVVTLDWSSWSAAFPPAGDRVLLSAVDGKHRWFDLPSGKTGDGWDAGPIPAGTSFRGLQVSADGRRVGSVVRKGGEGVAIIPAVVDGRTGEPVRQFGPEYVPGMSPTVSPDGQLAAVARMARPDGTAAIDVVDIDSGRLVGRAIFPKGNNLPVFIFTADSRSLLVHEDGEKKVRRYDLPARPRKVD
jgi:WD40 repeat protein